MRTIFAMALVGLMFAAVPATSQAAPGAPLSVELKADITTVTPVHDHTAGTTARAT
jgi:hypothetical protein